MTDWLNAAGSRPLLTPTQEINLGRQIRAWQDFEGGPDAAPAPIRRRGLRARNCMVEANLRLCPHIERRTRRGGEQIDRLQAGATGLIRAAEKFDPERGYKFSTYAYLWVRQKIERVVEAQPRRSGFNVPPNALGTPRAEQFERTAVRIDGSIADGEEGTLADLLADDRPGTDLLAAAALEAMSEADRDGLALLELYHHDGATQVELGALEGCCRGEISNRVSSVRRKFRRLPEVVAALA